MPDFNLLTRHKHVWVVVFKPFAVDTRTFLPVLSAQKKQHNWYPQSITINSSKEFEKGAISKIALKLELLQANLNRAVRASSASVGVASVTMFLPCSERRALKPQCLL